MVLALVVAVLAVALGLGLGLAPGARRHALGPLRTMALTAVLAVIAVHLLPEALAELGWVGLGLFAAALGLPRWLRRLRRSEETPHGGADIALELGFWGLVVHHVGDGLALGAYASVDTESGGTHGDVLLALVLHTVPLVAVVSSAYARAWGVKSAVLRSGLLALASSVGVLAAGLPPPELVERAEAWIAAGVAGLLLHGIAHDLTEDLPVDGKGRAFDLVAAIFGGAFGWLSAALDHHAEGEFSDALLVAFTRGVERTALPLLIGLVLAAALSSRLPGDGSTFTGSLRRSAFQAGVGLESLFLGFVQLGAALALAAHALVLVVLALAVDRSAVSEPSNGGFAVNLARRLDWFGVWAMAAFCLSIVLEASVPGGTLALVDEWVVLAVVIWLGVGLPAPAVATLGVASTLSGKGLTGASALLLGVWPPSTRSVERARRWLVIPALVFASFALGGALEPAPLAIDARVSWAAAAVLLALVVSRVYRLGLRGWIAPLSGARARPAAP